MRGKVDYQSQIYYAIDIESLDTGGSSAPGGEAASGAYAGSADQKATLPQAEDVGSRQGLCSRRLPSPRGYQHHANRFTLNSAHQEYRINGGGINE